MKNRTWLVVAFLLGALSLACGAGGAATPTFTPAAATPSLAQTPAAGETILAVFPLGGGAAWTYHAVIDTQTGTASEVEHWEGEISAAIGEALIEGAHTFFRVDWSGDPISRVQPDGARYYAPLGGALYEADSEATARALIGADGASYETAQVMAWPVSVGDVWGDPALVAQGGIQNVWQVIERAGVVQVPAGTFNDCTILAFVTNPDRSFRTFCPGVGFVRYEYVHNGTIHNEVWELISFVEPQQP